MQTIVATDFDNALYQLARLLQIAPECAPRGMKISELICPQIIIEHPHLCISTNSARKLSRKYLAAELLWYFSGDLQIDFISKYASMWSKISEDGFVNSNYGYFVFHQKFDVGYVSQFNFVERSLKDDKDSRQAVINYNQPRHKYDGNKDFVCTISQQFMIRDDKLLCINNVRSNDLIYGMCYDIPYFSFVHQLLYHMLLKTYPDLKLGRMIHQPASLHVYEKHYEMIDSIVAYYKAAKPVSDGLFNLCVYDSPESIIADMYRAEKTTKFMAELQALL